MELLKRLPDMREQAVIQKLKVADVDGKAKVRPKGKNMLCRTRGLGDDPFADRNNHTLLFQCGDALGKRNILPMHAPAEQDLAAEYLLRSGFNLRLDNDMEAFKAVVDTVIEGKTETALFSPILYHMGRKFQIIQRGEASRNICDHDGVVNQLLRGGPVLRVMQHACRAGIHHMDSVFGTGIQHDIAYPLDRKRRLQVFMGESEEMVVTQAKKTEERTHLYFQLAANLTQDSVSRFAAESKVDIVKRLERKAEQEQGGAGNAADSRQLLFCRGQIEKPSGRINGVFVFQADHATGKEERAGHFRVPLHNAAAMDPQQLPRLVVNTVADRMDLAFLFNHILQIGYMKRLIRLINPLLQQVDKIIHKIVCKIEFVFQVIGNKIDIFLHITTIEVKGGICHGDGLEKDLGIKKIVAQEVLERGFPGGEAGRRHSAAAQRGMARLAGCEVDAAIVFPLILIHQIVRFLYQGADILAGIRCPQAADRQLAIAFSQEHPQLGDALFKVRLRRIIA